MSANINCSRRIVMVVLAHAALAACGQGEDRQCRSYDGDWLKQQNAAIRTYVDANVVDRAELERARTSAATAALELTRYSLLACAAEPSVRVNLSVKQIQELRESVGVLRISRLDAAVERDNRKDLLGMIERRNSDETIALMIHGDKGGAISLSVAEIVP